MADNLMGDIPLDFQPQMQNISQQQKMAQMLLQQAQQQPQGQMISGQYVAPSIFQQLTPLFAAYAGSKGMETAEKKQLDLAKQLREGKSEALGTFQQLISNPETRGQAMQFAAKSPYLQGITQELMKPQKLGEGENIVMPSLGGGEPITLAGGGMKAAPEIKQAMQMLGINKSLDKLSPQELQMVNTKIDQLNASKRSSLTVHMPTEGERKGGFMANILDRNLLQMQTALGVDPSAVKPNVPASVVEAITGPNLLSRSMKPEQRQIIEDSQLDVLDAALTLRTGAAYTREQLNAMRDTYFPVLGDKPKAINAKRQRLETLLEGAYIVSGRATPQRVSSPPSSGLPAQPNLNQQLNIPAAPAAPKFLGFE